MKNILLTGSNGMVGRQIISHLSIAKPDIAIREFDTSDYYDWRSQWVEVSQVDYDLIIHCGAISDSRETGLRIWQMNFAIMDQIIDYASTRGTHVLYFSSCAARHAVTSYGMTKKLSEQWLCDRIHESRLCIFRPFNIYSYHEEFKLNPSIFYKAINKDLPTIYRDVVRDFIYLQDVICATDHILTNWQSGIFDIGTGVGINIEKLARICYDNQDLPSITEPPPQVPKALVADPRKMPEGWMQTYYDWRIKKCM